MRLHIDLGTDHQLITRLLPYWEKMGIEIVSLDQAQIHLSFVTFTKPSSIPKILRLDGVYYNVLSPYILENRPLLKAYRECQGIIFQSQYSLRCAQAHFGNLDPALPRRVIYNGMDPGWNDPVRHENFNIVVCSRWRVWKRLQEMIDTVAEVVETYPDIRLHIVGVGKGMTVRGRHEFIRWAGDLNYIQMREFYRKMDLAIHIAKRDWCPNVVLEFMAAGIPTIVSDRGGGATELAELVDSSLIAMDDDDPSDTEPVAQYTSAWNKLSSDFRANVQSKIQLTYHDRRRVSLPTTLTTEHVAESYLKFMEEFV